MCRPRAHPREQPLQLPSSGAGTDTHIDYGFTAEALVAAWAESGMPTRASALTTGPLAEQPEIIDAMIARLDTVPDFKNKADLRQAVVDANARAKEKRAALQRAEADADLAYSRLQTARATLRTALTQLHSRLLSVYPDRKDFVESFFLRRKVRKGDTEVETLPETAPPPSA